ncbi:MAG: hypothetical protein IJY26_03500 [Clostridia bacterium]|nr:hypothetical protein [Clostridia bacterium]
MASTKEKKKLSWWAKTLFILGMVVLFLGVVLLGAIGYFRLFVHSYYSASEKAFEIPDLNAGFIPQGMRYDERQKGFFITGYSNTEEASPVYIVKDESVKSVRLLKEDGSAYTGHCGGIAVFNDYVYIAGGSGNCLYIYSYSEIINAEEGAGVVCKGKFSLKTSNNDYLGASFVTVYGNKMVVGELYRAQNYPTLPSHKITTSAGDYNQAIALEFSLSADAQFGIEPTPTSAYSLPDQVQGMCFAEGKIYLSTSYGVAFSHILEYTESALTNEGQISLLGTELPLFSLDSASLSKDYKIAPMSGGIVMLDGELYVMCESASDKYIFGKFTGAQWCYKTDLSQMQ